MQHPRSEGLVTAALAALLLEACATGTWRAPPPPTVDRYTPAAERQSKQDAAARGVEQTLAVGESIAPDWWKSFGSAQLDDLVRQALAGSLTLESAKRRLEAEQEAASAARASLYPQLTLSAQLARQRESSTAFGLAPNAFPLPLTMELLQRGQERYGIFCQPCHGIEGDGQGMVAMRGMKHPPSFHQDRLRAEPNGYIYDVVTNGFGAMYGYSAQIPPRDRWAVIAYLRALQLSRNAPVKELPADLREKLMGGGAAK